MSLLGEIPLTEGDLEKTIGTLIYLENLKKEKENSSEMEPCPICCLSSESGVSFSTVIHTYLVLYNFSFPVGSITMWS